MDECRKCWLIVENVECENEKLKMFVECHKCRSIVKMLIEYRKCRMNLENVSSMQQIFKLIFSQKTSNQSVVKMLIENRIKSIKNRKCWVIVEDIDYDPKMFADFQKFRYIIQNVG